MVVREQWWDTASPCSNLEPMLRGRKLNVAGRQPVIQYVPAITVGIDSHGIFASIRVVADGTAYELHTDGSVHDEDDHEVGRHEFTFKSLKAAV